MGLELDYIFHPRSIAVAGASESPDKFGHTYFKNVLEHFSGPVYPINGRATEILGEKTYASVRDVPGPVDYVVSAVPNNAALGLVDDCVAKGVKALHFFTARFSETGSEEGAQMERDMLAKAQGGGHAHPWPQLHGAVLPQGGHRLGQGVPVGVRQRGHHLAERRQRRRDDLGGRRRAASATARSSATATRSTSTRPTCWSTWPTTRRPGSSADTSRASRTDAGSRRRSATHRGASRWCC